MNKWFLGVLSIGVSVLGFHLGSRQVEEKLQFKNCKDGRKVIRFTKRVKRSPSEKTIDKKKLSLKFKRLPQSQGARAGEKKEKKRFILELIWQTEKLKNLYKNKKSFPRL